MLRKDMEDPKAFVRFPAQTVVLQKGISEIKVPRADGCPP
jgi:hypothetical protein